MPAADLRSTLHAQIDLMDEAQLAVVERVLLALEAEMLSAGISAGFDTDRARGSLTPERVQDMVAQVRADHPYR